ncbi:MAG: hypothetical protein R3C04_07675 [Hyphomonas sp.]
MAEKKVDLTKIVALKRQKAEQDFRAVQIEREQMSEEAERLAAALRALDDPGPDVDATILALRHGHVRKVMSDMAAGNAAAVQKDAELDEAREALKRAFDSEERLKDMKTKR